MVGIPSEQLWQRAWWGPFVSVALVLLLQFASHWTLLWSMAGKGRWLRRLLLAISLYLISDIAFNRSITLGSRLRDTSIGTLAWYLLSKSLAVGLVYDLNHPRQPLPRWIVPDWKAEAGKEDVVANGASDAKQDTDAQHNTPKHPATRQSITKRPAWARRTNVIPRFWVTLDYPTTRADQLLWALDVWLIRRPGTSLAFAEEMRALEWSKDRLQVAARWQHEKRLPSARKDGQSTTSAVPTQGQVQPFGYAETTLWQALTDTAFFALCLVYMTSLDLHGSTYADFFSLPWKQKLALTSSIGTCVALSGTLADHLLVPLMQRWPLYLPATAVVPMFRNVGRSQSITELWSWRWHAFTKRDFLALSRLLFFLRGSRAAMLFNIFFWSGVMHSMLFMHIQAPPDWRSPWSVVRLFVAPGPMLFFLSQAGVILIEQSLQPVLSRAIVACRGRLQKDHVALFDATVETARLLWVWAVLLLTGQFLAAELVQCNILNQEQILTMRPNAIIGDFARYLTTHLADEARKVSAYFRL